MSERAYVSVLGGFVAVGLFISALMSVMSYDWAQPSWLFLIVVGLGIPIAGIVISFKSDDWIVSTIGYLMVVGPFGLILGPTLALYEINSVLLALVTTFMVTVVMWVIAMITPAIVKNLEGGIIVALLVLIFAPFTGWLVESAGGPAINMDIWHWAGAILFTGLIFYDVNKAMQREYTLDTAVDSAVGIYLDIINLFLRILSILGNKRD